MADQVEALTLEVDNLVGTQDLSDEKIATITREIMADSLKRERESQVFVGKHLENDWDDELYVRDLYEQMLQAVQLNSELKHRNGQKLNVRTLTFVEYLGFCLETLTHRRDELKVELDRGDINLPIYNNGKMLVDMAEQAIKKYLEKNETAKLIGV